jgi:RNA polymerase sigma-70 factor (ECF subfamily)
VDRRGRVDSVKDAPPSPHDARSVDLAIASHTPAATALDVTAIHAAHAEFVWLLLQRFGVREADLEDALQEVFIVVHQRLHTYDGASKITSWLYGIAQYVAIAWRRKAHVRREHAVEAVPEPAHTDAYTPEHAASDRQARARLESMLDELDPDKRAVFVMFEIDRMSCDEIAALVGVPVGTVYSRLHGARKAFEKSLARWRARDANGGPR